MRLDQPKKEEIKDNKPFMSNGFVINHQPDKFVLDFQSIFPQFNLENHPTIVVNHKVILLDPHMVLLLHSHLGSNIKKYEETFNKIEVPAAVEKMKKEIEKAKKSKKPVDLSYLG